MKLEQEMDRYLKEQGRITYKQRDFRLICEESGPTLGATLRRAVRAGVLVHVARDEYVYRRGAERDIFRLYKIAADLRRGEAVVESYESAAAAWGLISQAPVSTLTCITTGRSGAFDTPYGRIEFTHTAASLYDLHKTSIARPEQMVPLATKEAVRRHMMRAGRSVDLIREHEERMREWGGFDD